MVTGVSASIATFSRVVLEENHRVEILWPAMMLAGVFLILFSVFNLSFISRFISKNVMIGFCNGLSILIFKFQLHNFQDTNHEWVQGEIALHMSIICILSAVSFEFWPNVPWISKVIPPAMVSFGIALGYEYLIVKLWRGMSTITIGDHGLVLENLPSLAPFWQYPGEIANISYNRDDIGLIFRTAISFFVIIVLESLMTIGVMDTRYSDSSNADQSIFAMGLANIVSGFFGGLGGNTMIGLSNMLANGGGYGKVAPFIASILIFLYTLLTPNLLSIVPSSCLAGIMFVVAAHTFSFDSLRMVTCSFLPEWFLNKYNWAQHGIPIMDALILLLVSILVPVLGLDVAIIVGAAISGFYFIHKTYRQMRVFKHIALRDDIGLVAVYDIYGPVFFSSTAGLEKAFDFKTDPDIIIIRMKNSVIMDYSAMVCLSTIRSKYELEGKELLVKNLKVECENKLLRARARLKWDGDPDHLTNEIRIMKLDAFEDEVPCLPGTEIYLKEV